MFLALILLVGSLAVLGQHVSLGVRAADEARLRTKAEEFATTKMNEVLAGIEPLQTVGEAPLQGDDGLWSYSMTVAAGPAEGLLDVSVTVLHEGLGDGTNEAFRLQQFVRDPAVLLDAEVSASSGGTL
ncbi:hypothetical protein [Alienimonas californiensis]|uniref:General secretion pathway protein I n=1 Tax=Alienimonas californiensis TaxID=2527989 RepID=A0A517PDY0_9PLAN|nr:hypothetical protein [Alienimonas californiensis]QDT17567.1 hypothetical protein CA12_36950 [Alienimonas californiensis]